MSAHGKSVFIYYIISPARACSLTACRACFRSEIPLYPPRKQLKKPNRPVRLSLLMVEIGSRLTASAHGKHAFLSSFICASVQPDADEVRSGLHSPYLRHLPEKKKKTRTDRIFLGRWWTNIKVKRTNFIYSNCYLLGNPKNH